MRRALLLSLGLVAALGLAGCFSVTEPICSFACSDTDPKCPTDYECLSDGYCHLHGNPQSCGFSDAAVPNDLAVSTPDLPASVDMTQSD